MNLAKILQEGEIESFDSFFSGLSARDEKRAIQLYEQYIRGHTRTTVKTVLKEVIQMCDASKYVFERPKDDYLPEVYKHLESKNEAKEDIILNLKSQLNDI